MLAATLPRDSLQSTPDAKLGLIYSQSPVDKLCKNVLWTAANGPVTPV